MADQRHSEDKSGETITDTKSLTTALQQVRGVALAGGMSREQFKECAIKASKQLKLRPLTHDKGKRRSWCNCITILKILWLMILLLLAVAMVSAAFKPVMFFMHKVGTINVTVNVFLSLHTL